MQHDLKGLVELLLRVCIMDGKVSEKNFFIDGVSHKRNVLRGFIFRTLFTNGLLC